MTLTVWVTFTQIPAGMGQEDGEAPATASEEGAGGPTAFDELIAATNREGRIELSLRDCLFLTLRNNLRLEIEALRPALAEADVRLQGGAFEPQLTLRSSYTDQTQPRDAESQAATGIAQTESRSENYEVSVNGLLPTGTEWSLRARTRGEESTFNDFDPLFNATSGITVTQPLLRGAGFGANLADLRIARKEVEASGANFREQVKQIITDVYFAYYNLLFRIADLNSRQESLELAERLIEENQARFELGSMSSLDVTQARSAAASRRQELVQARSDLESAQTTLKRLIYADLLPHLTQQIVPAEVPPPATVPALEVNIGNALRLRDDLIEQRARIEQSGIRLRFAKNELLPTVDLEATYNLLGQDGAFGQSFARVSERENPEWTVGVVVTIPLGARQERARYERAKLERRQRLVEYKELEQEIIAEVDNAVRDVRTSRERYTIAQEATVLARETLEAEQERLSAGTTTTFVVSQLQTDFTVARTAELRALADWYQAIAELARVEGTTLVRNRILIAE